MELVERLEAPGAGGVIEEVVQRFLRCGSVGDPLLIGNAIDAPLDDDDVGERLDRDLGKGLPDARGSQQGSEDDEVNERGCD